MFEGQLASMKQFVNEGSVCGLVSADRSLQQFVNEGSVCGLVSADRSLQQYVPFIHMHSQHFHTQLWCHFEVY